MASSTLDGAKDTQAHQKEGYKDKCGRCGATRTDQQLGLEPTPEEYVARMVAVFREVRRVLRSDGTLWLNMGDSYAGSWGNQGRKAERGTQRPINGDMLTPVLDGRYPDKGSNTGAVPAGLKPKDLVGIPWRLAFALQADGWYLRSDVIWSKPNPMPESVTDRPTKSHEYLFLLTRSPRYYFDQEAVREPHSPDGRHKTVHDHLTDKSHPNYDNVGNGNERWPNSGRNIRSVWTIPTHPFPEAHFATFPPKLVEPCVLAGCPEWVCGTCGKPRVRIVERQPLVLKEPEIPIRERRGDSVNDKRTALSGTQLIPASATTLGWSDCGHDNYTPGVVLDPFSGSGTTGLVAYQLNREYIGIELNPSYAEMSERRLANVQMRLTA